MHNGSCLCGSIQYVIDDNLKFIVNCHCRFCRKAHGAPFTTLLFMPFARLTVTQGQELPASYEIKALDATRCFGLPQFSSAPSPAEFAKLKG